MKPQPVKNQRILLADDDIDDLMIMREVLENFDSEYDVVEAHNGQEVLNYLNNIVDPTLYPSLIILDINMPMLDGRETLKHLKSEPKYSSLSVVIFTTAQREKDREFFRSYGVEMFTKPNSFEVYVHIILQLLSLRGIAN